MGFIYPIRTRLSREIKQLPQRYLEFRRNRELNTFARREKPLLEKARRELEPLYHKADNPLISIKICTYNRADLLINRALPSLLNQTYDNFEVNIVGDCCTDDTEQQLKKLNDPRIRFENLPVWGPYPKDPTLRHMISGVHPCNRSLDMAQGLYIAHMDDDDTWTPDHLESLLREIQSSQAELSWAKAKYEYRPDRWKIEGNPGFEKMDVPHSTVFFRTYLNIFKCSPTCYKVRLGGDRHMFGRMLRCGIRTSFLDKIVAITPLRPGNTGLWGYAEDIHELGT